MFFFKLLFFTARNYKSRLNELILHHSTSAKSFENWKPTQLFQLSNALWSVKNANKAYKYYKELHKRMNKDIGHSDSTGKRSFNIQFLYILYSAMVYKKKIPKQEKKNLGNFFKELDSQIFDSMNKMGQFDYEKNFKDRYITSTVNLPKRKKRKFKRVIPNLNKVPSAKKQARRLQFYQKEENLKHFHSEENSIFLRNLFNHSTKYIFLIYLAKIYVNQNIILTAYLRVFYILINLFFLY